MGLPLAVAAVVACATRPGDAGGQAKRSPHGGVLEERVVAKAVHGDGDQDESESESGAAPQRAARVPEG